MEVSESGDHYDPMAKMVRLVDANYRGRSLTATTVAAHEVGHAVQDAEGFAPLRWRTRLVRWAGPVEKAGALMFMAAPVIAGLTRSPHVGLLMALGGFLSLGSTVVIHLLTLPTELDASFGRAMPLLEEQGVLYEADQRHARKLLRAAALSRYGKSLAPPRAASLTKRRDPLAGRARRSALRRCTSTPRPTLTTAMAGQEVRADRRLQSRLSRSHPVQVGTERLHSTSHSISRPLALRKRNRGRAP